MAIKIIFDAVSGQTWAVRLIQEGDAYGLADQLVHDESEPLVEFYDTRYEHTDLGQFVTRYKRGTLLERQSGEGLNLCGTEPSWQMSAAAIARVIDWLQTTAETPPVMTREALHGELQRQALQCARLAGSTRMNENYGDNYWTVTLHADGTTQYENYAQEARGLDGNVADLQDWELLKLLGPEPSRLSAR